MSRRNRLILALLAAPVLATFAPVSLFSEPVPPARLHLNFKAVPLDKDDPGRRSAGKLLYLRGWWIRSNDGRFGGISAMHVERGRVIALSDAGWLFRFPLPTRGEGPLSITPLPEGPGLARVKGDRDVEAMTVHRGRAWLAFEGRNAIWRYDLDDWTSSAAAAPAAMNNWPANQGSEAIVRLTDGRFLVFAEHQRSDGTSAVVLFSGDPTSEGSKAELLSYAAPKGYKITDAALLPDGRILFLNRRVSVADGISAKLTVAVDPAPMPGSVLGGTELAHFEAPVIVDNMEALSVGQENGRTIIWIGSDDNYIPLQRTLLLKFALVE